MTEQDEGGTPAPEETAFETAAGLPSTGVPAADAARERLATVDDTALDQHVEVYEDVHRRLQEGLADLDES